MSHGRRRLVRFMAATCTLALAPGLAAASPEQATTLPEGSVLVTSSRLGAPVDVDARVISADPPETVRYRPKRYAGHLEIVQVQPAGEVAADDVLMRLSSFWIDQEIDRARVDLELALAKHERSVVTHQQKNERLCLDLREAKRNQQIAERNLSRFENSERAVRTEEQEQRLRRSRDAIQNQQEELEQLTKMYTEDDLTEETEDIVLKRARRALERSRVDLKNREARARWFLEQSLVEEHEHHKIKVHKTRLHADTVAKTLDLNQRVAELELRKSSLDVKSKRRALRELEEDRAALTLLAPRAGYAVPGTFDQGMWKGIRAQDDALQPGDRIRRDSVLYTVVSPHSKRLRGTVAQGALAELAVGHPVRAISSLHPDLVLHGTVAHLDRLPRNDRYDVTIDLEEGEGEAPALPVGSKIRATVIGSSAVEALHIPADAVRSSGKNDKRTHTVLRWEAGAWVPVTIDLGVRVADRVLIEGGLEVGDALRAEAPSKDEAETDK